MKKRTLLLALSALLVLGCKKNVDDESYTVDSTNETAQQVGDAMASMDESGGTTNGAVASLEIQSYQKAFARLSAGEASKSENIFKALFPMAQAAACNTIAFSSCTASQKTRSVTGCTTAGGGTMDGNVTLEFSGSGAGTCTIPNATDSVSRKPNYSITGLRGATFTVSAPSTGQTLTRTGATTFDFTNSGIRRTFVTPKGTTLLDVTAATGSAISVTGNNRNTRTMSGGSLVVTNNLTSVSCTLTPSSVQWTSACNCPTAGSWSGTCSDASSFQVAFSSTCGQTTVTKDGVATTVTMDRCQQ
jgi:hypothetical protein